MSLETKPREEFQFLSLVGWVILVFTIFPFFFAKGGLDLKRSMHFSKLNDT